MIRRNFFKVMGAATAGGLASLDGVAAGPTKTVVFHVKGFSCVTCATGLDTMLKKEPGIVSSASTYPEAMATVKFDPKKSSPDTIAEFISGLGFTPEQVSLKD
jgi:copper chaperone CopZ